MDIYLFSRGFWGPDVYSYRLISISILETESLGNDILKVCSYEDFLSRKCSKTVQSVKSFVIRTLMEGICPIWLKFFYMWVLKENLTYSFIF